MASTTTLICPISPNSKFWCLTPVSPSRKLTAIPTHSLSRHSPVTRPTTPSCLLTQRTHCPPSLWTRSPTTQWSSPRISSATLWTTICWLILPTHWAFSHPIFWLIFPMNPGTLLLLMAVSTVFPSAHPVTTSRIPSSSTTTWCLSWSWTFPKRWTSSPQFWELWPRSWADPHWLSISSLLSYTLSPLHSAFTPLGRSTPLTARRRFSSIWTLPDIRTM